MGGIFIMTDRGWQRLGGPLNWKTKDTTPNWEKIYGNKWEHRVASSEAAKKRIEQDEEESS